MHIRVLHVHGCENYKRALEEVQEALHRLRLHHEYPELEAVESMEQARELRFLGSPTIQIDGVDVEPAARSRTDFNLG